MEVKKLLLPVDGSEYSNKAAQYGLELAKLLGAEVILLNAHKAVSPTLGEPNRQQALDDAVAEATMVVAPYETMAQKAGVAYETRVLGGPTAEVIYDVAEAEKADMVVMGSRGKSELQGLLVGSVTHRLLHIAPCPVLVIR
jgi:nucleotide-binding universal stress UspA family protein